MDALSEVVLDVELNYAGELRSAGYGSHETHFSLCLIVSVARDIPKPFASTHAVSDLSRFWLILSCSRSRLYYQIGLKSPHADVFEDIKFLKYIDRIAA